MVSTSRTPRPGRLPAQVRSAIDTVTDTYTCGTDQQYAQALETLARVCADLSPAQLRGVNDRLHRAHQQVRTEQLLSALAAAHASGQLRTVRVLPGGVEVVEVTGRDDQLLVTLPHPLDTDTGKVRDLVEQSRAAVVAGRCPRCAGQVTGTAEQLTLNHTRGCPISEQAIDRARRAR